MTCKKKNEPSEKQEVIELTSEALEGVSGGVLVDVAPEEDPNRSDLDDAVENPGNMGSYNSGKGKR